jgi:hypothetical protein
MLKYSNKFIYFKYLFGWLSGPRSRPTAAQKNLTTPRIEPGTPVLVARHSDH